MYLVELQVRRKIRDAGMKMSKGLLPALEGIVEGLIEEAVARAKAEKRKTVMPRDLPLESVMKPRRTIPIRSRVIHRPDSGIITGR